MSTSRSLTPLLVTAPLLLLFGALGTGWAWLSDGLSQSQTDEQTAGQYGVALLIALSGPIALLVAALRTQPTRLRRAVVITGAVLTGVAVLVSGIPFAVSLGVVIHNATLRTQPVTAEETTSIDELSADSSAFLDESIGALENVERSGENASASTRGCQLSNLEQGSSWSSFEVLYLPVGRKDEVLDAIVSQWESQGYDVERFDDAVAIDDQEWIRTAQASWYSDDSSDVGNLSFDVTSICVVKN